MLFGKDTFCKTVIEVHYKRYMTKCGKKVLRK